MVVLVISGLLMIAALLLSGDGTICLATGTFNNFLDNASDATTRHYLAMGLGLLSSCLLWVGIGILVYEKI